MAGDHHSMTVLKGRGMRKVENHALQELTALLRLNRRMS